MRILILGEITEMMTTCFLTKDMNTDILLSQLLLHLGGDLHLHLFLEEEIQHRHLPSSRKWIHLQV
jgi:hypothetical protein